MPVVFVFALVVIRLVRSFGASFRDAEFRALLFMVAVALAAGTLFYRNVEGWRVLDAFYFSVITLATVGYGDLTPKTDLGKLFTVLYIVIGISLLAGFAQKVAKVSFERRRERLQSQQPRHRRIFTEGNDDEAFDATARRFEN